MRVARFRQDDRTGLGIVVGDPEPDTVVDLARAAPDLPTEPLAFLEAGPDAWDAAREAAESAGADARLDLDAVTLVAPVPRPPKFLAIGLNYADHVAESSGTAPEHQLWFNKQPTCVIGPGEAIHKPRASDLVDYEGELGVVIGRRCRHVPRDRALDIVFGYTIVDDVSVRDWQLRSPTMTMGKSFDTHGPIGPWIVTADEVPDPQDLRIRTWVDDELVQDESTKQMIFDVAAQIEHLTTAFTLEPGDVLATGTPAGVGIARKPPLLLRDGMRVRIEIEGIGTLENPVVDEPDTTAVG